MESTNTDNNDSEWPTTPVPNDDLDLQMSDSNDFSYTYTPFKTAEGQEYNEEDLKNLAESLAPRVTSLLHSNEAALENLLSSTRNLVELGDVDETGGSDQSMNEEDGIEGELDRLADAERLLRDELEMSNVGFDFMRYAYVDESRSESESESSEHGDHSDGIISEDDEEEHGVVLHDAAKDDNAVVDNSFLSVDDHDGIYESSSSDASFCDSQGERGLDRETKTEPETASKPIGTVSMLNILSDDSAAASVSADVDAGADSNTGRNTVLPRNAGTTIRRSVIAEIPASVPLPAAKGKQVPKTSGSKKEAYTLYDHAKRIGLLFDNADLGYPSCPILSEKDAESILDVPIFRADFIHAHSPGLDVSDEDESDDIANPPRIVKEKINDEARNNAIRDILQCTGEYIKPMKSTALSRIFMGLTDERKNYHKDTKLKRRRRKDGDQDDQNRDVEDVGISITDINGVPIGGPNREIVPVRTVTIQIRPDVLVGAVMDAVYTSINSLFGEVTKRQGGSLRALIPGIWVKECEFVPFRNPVQTTGISSLFGSPMMQPTREAMNGMIFQPPLVIDAQLCTRKKSRLAERVLLVRCFSISDGQILDNGAAVCPSNKGPPHAPLEGCSSHTDLSEIANEKANNILRESSSLFQRMRSVATLGGKIAFDLGEHETNDQSMQTPRSAQHQSYMKKILTSPLKLFSPSPQRKKRQSTPRRQKKKALNVRFDSPKEALIGQEAAQKLVSEKLVSVFTDTPSVLDEVYDIDPLAALSPLDWPYLQSSSSFLTDCLNELDNRDLGYSTLASCAFGTFPALMSLDGHYCSQIRDICKENMIASLLKSAQELEIYAREAEYGCAKLMQILEPTLFSYDEQLPELPEAIPLTSYPLNFTPNEVTSPPWGQKVIEALNLIAAKSSSNKNGIEEQMNKLAVQSTPNDAFSHSETEFSKAKDAVYMVLTAFQKQEDEELSARVGRKNCQVMDRLAKMQAYKRESIMTIRGSYGINTLATKAADKFHTHAKEYCKIELDDAETTTVNSQMKMTILPASDQVPLLTCRVMHGGSAGTCYLTYHEILLVTQSIPLVGGNYLNLVPLNDVEVEVRSKGKKSRLNPMPSVLIVKRKDDGKEVFSFRPSTGAHLFKDFVDIIQDIAHESPDAVNFSSRGGLLKMFDEKNSVAEAALGRDPRIL